ncbi:MAG: AAA family ATPase [Janthinobacterium lividum]
MPLDQNISEADTSIEDLSLRALVSIEVDQLFGTFSYRLNSKDAGSKLVILYGDNGSGKSTILECIYHLLSPAPDEGHRFFISNVPFKSFQVTFNDGWGVEVQKRAGLTGSYDLICYEPGRATFSLEFDAERKQFKDEAVEAYTSYLRKLNLEIFFLRADRSFTSDSHAQARRAERDYWKTYSAALLRKLEPGSAEADQELNSLKNAINRANEYLRRLASRAANAGGASANSIYEDVLSKIVSSEEAAQKELGSSRTGLEIRLQILAERSKHFSKFSLTAPLQAAAIIKTIRIASDQRFPLVASVLEPYLGSVEARLKELEPIQELVESLVEDVNSFFTNKQLRFRLSSGIQITSLDGAPLSPDLLSSGEKHLLLMFCRTVIAHGRRTLFIIDEPELSLNIKWQHRIVERLLHLIKSSPTQFVFATHSIELLSQHLDQVFRLPTTPSQPKLLFSRNANG